MRRHSTEPEDKAAIDDQGREYVAHHHPFPANAVGYLVAPAIWFAYFISVYSLQGIGCAAGFDAMPLGPTTLLEVLLGALTLGASIALVVLGTWSFVAWRRLLRELEDAKGIIHGHSTFLAYGALLHAGLFLLATLWSGVPILLTDTCDSLGST